VDTELPETNAVNMKEILSSHVPTAGKVAVYKERYSKRNIILPFAESIKKNKGEKKHEMELYVIFQRQDCHNTQP
jgi:hypothetical protein